MIEILNTTLPKEDYGPEIQNDVAKSVNRLFTNKQAKDKLDALRSEHKIPVNCKELAVPKLNNEIWTTINPKVRSLDCSHQAIQQQLSLAGIMTAKIAETIFMAGSKIEKSMRDDLLKRTLESLSLVGNAMQDLNQKRKQDLRPFLSKEASAICSTTQSTEWLFGDNVTEQMKLAKTTANVLRSSVTSPHSFTRTAKGGRRFYPYKNQGQIFFNWQGPVLSQRGEMTTRGNCRRRRSQFQ